MESLGHIERKSMLYRTKVEYGDWAMNHVQGCSHGCTYPCYAYLMAKRFGRVHNYSEWCKPFIVDNTLELLKRELPRHRNEIKRVQLCFTTDPFMMGYPEVESMSLNAIRLINSFNIPCVILTKGLLPTDLSQLPRKKLNHYGITLVSLNEEYRKEFEPGASPLRPRLSALRNLHDNGCKTWVSMEPYPTPNICNQKIETILDSINFVDKIVFGKTHYDKRTGSYLDHGAFYRSVAENVSKYCFENGINCHIKSGTAD